MIKERTMKIYIVIAALEIDEREMVKERETKRRDGWEKKGTVIFLSAAKEIFSGAIKGVVDLLHERETWKVFHARTMKQFRPYFSIDSRLIVR